MPSLEKTPGRAEKSPTEGQPSMRSALDGVQTAAEHRFTSVESAIHEAQRTLRGTDQAGDVDGALVDLRASNRRLHTEVLTALGQQAERQHPAEAQGLVQRGRGLLAAQERFAEAA